MLSKLITFCKQYEKDILLTAIIVLTAFLSFGLGRLSKIRENKIPITIENYNLTETVASSTKNEIASAENYPNQTGLPFIYTDGTQAGKLVASKNGKNYYYPWCSGVQRIKEENKVWFSSEQEAQKAGYSPSANCKGLK